LLARDTLELVISSVTFIVMGMFLGNLILITLGLFPIVFISLGIIIGQPEVTEVGRKGEDLKVWIDDQVGDSITARISGGPGVVTVGDILPKFFRLEEGTNFKAVWKGLAEVEVEFGYKAACAKRGYFEIGGVSWEARHPLQITQNDMGETPAPRTYLVQPKPLLVRRVRERKAISKVPMPMEARIKFGVPTTDFLELRDYLPGDSYRMINWKASARRLSAHPGQFLVNEYEKEGKKVVWVFLDTTARMALGTAVMNTLEYAVRAALGFTHYYLSRDCKVGLCLYDNDAYQWEGTFQRTSPAIDLALELSNIDQMEVIEPVKPVEAGEGEERVSRRRVLFPDVGKRQQFKVMREMLNVEVGYSTDSLKETIHTARRFIVGTLPLFVIITMIDAGRVQGLLDGIRELHKYTGRRSTRSSIVIFNVKGYSVAAQSDREELAAEMLDYHNHPVYQTLRRFGAVVVNWDPATHSFAHALRAQGG